MDDGGTASDVTPDAAGPHIDGGDATTGVDSVRPARPNVEYGDRQIAVGNEILRSVVGSGVHGMAIEGTDDHDEMGVFIEPPDCVIGVHKSFDQYVSRTQPEGVRSGPGDIDLTIYSLRKYVRLALAGNPTILLPLYAPRDALPVLTTLGWQLRHLTPQIVSRSAGRRFLGPPHSRREARE